MTNKTDKNDNIYISIASPQFRFTFTCFVTITSEENGSVVHEI
jgi:hypothetical protein